MSLVDHLTSKLELYIRVEYIPATWRHRAAAGLDPLTAAAACCVRFYGPFLNVSAYEEALVELAGRYDVLEARRATADEIPEAYKDATTE